MFSLHAIIVTRIPFPLSKGTNVHMIFDFIHEEHDFGRNFFPGLLNGSDYRSQFYIIRF